MTPYVIRLTAPSVRITIANNITPRVSKTTGFSLVEVTLALGVAAICLIAMLGLMPTSLKTQQNSVRQTTANQIISQIFSVLRGSFRTSNL